MKITKRLFTYPVLSMDNDDYLSSTFKVDSSRLMSGVNTLQLHFNIKLDCAALQKMINCGEAEYLIHIECSTTAYRTTLISHIGDIRKDIPISRINGIVEMVAFIVAKKDIKSFESNDWNEDFKDMKFNIEKGSILAYENLSELDVTKDYEEFSNATSIFMIYKKASDEMRPFNVEMESNMLKVGLGTKDYKLYSKYYKRSDMQPILNSMIILPALVFIFEELKQENGIEQYKNRRWYEMLERSYEKRGIDLEKEIVSEEKKSIQLAQEAMEYPVSQALLQISNMYDEEEEDD